ncbi:hypothetical protein IEQ34_012022 [Dendrobium chrysotoxum]|uniref:Rhodanese domain-containing protein n=1 Tax=Dendrobium chrysotoxum TaxID=161865 RepID=A0AAV7GU37_DENCH|nr:hypothetical protein IEQ34_012022 [Dendrobium chrysotoxum]
MLPVCSAAPCCSSFHHMTYVGNRMLYQLRKLGEDRFFIDERQGFYAHDGNRIPDMSFRTKATKFIYSPVVEAPDLSAFQDPSTFPPYPDSFDDIARGFPNESIDEHENWTCLANEISRSCPLTDDLKYVADSDMPGSYMVNHELEGEYLNGINHGSTSLEALASQNIDLSTVADAEVDKVAEVPDLFDQNLNGLSNLASDAAPDTLPGSPVMVADMPEVVSKGSLYLKENIGSFFSGIEESVDKLLNRADDSLTTTLDAWKLSLSDTVNGVTKTYDGIGSSFFSSIDDTKGQASNQLARFSIKLGENISKAGAVVLDILRWIIIGVGDGISNGVTFVLYAYASAKTFLPPDIRNALNMFEDDVTQSLSPIGATFRKVIEEIERNLGLDPNDPVVPFLLISYWLYRYDGYSLSPERTSELLKNDKNVLLVDALKEREGIPDLRRAARSKYASINLIEIDDSIRKLLKGGREVDNALIAVVIRNFKNIKKGTKIVVMDSDAGRSKAIARSLKKLGVKEPYFVEGGFQAWTRKGLRIKEPRPETALTILNEGTLVAIYAFLEWEKTLQIIGIVGLGQTLYRRVASYKDSDDLKRDVRVSANKRFPHLLHQKAAKKKMENAFEDVEISAKRKTTDCSEDNVDFARFDEVEPNLAEGVVDINLTEIYKCEKEAYEMYCTYAHNTGFSVRKDHHSYWPNSRKIRSKDFVCSKAGFKKGPDLNLQMKYRKSDTRTGCPAIIRFIVDDGNWKVQKFIESHNHDLVRAEDKHLLRSCRSMSDEKSSVLKMMTEAGIRIIDAFSYLAHEVGGFENIGITKRDAYNYIQKERRARIKFGVTNSLIQLFKQQQIDDLMFAWDIQFDELDRLQNFFGLMVWAG